VDSESQIEMDTIDNFRMSKTSMFGI